MDGHAFYPLNDTERRAVGSIPRIDKNIYARENGWAISSLAAFYDATNDKKTLTHAITAANWIKANRSIGQGGFSHSAKDKSGPFLGDTLAMAEAYLALYVSTADRTWLDKSKQSMLFIDHTFKLSNSKINAGYITALNDNKTAGVFKQPLLQMEQNVSIARLSNQLAKYTGEQKYRDMALHAMKYLVGLATPDYQQYLSSALIASEETHSEPAHITIVGSKKDPAAIKLFEKALQYPAVYRRIEWWDKAEGPMPNKDVQYPQLKKSAAFICANNACSIPIFDPNKISIKADAILLTQ